MTIDRIKFSCEFTYHGLGRWLTTYATLEAGDDPKESGKKLMEETAIIIQEAVKSQSDTPLPDIQQPKKLTGIEHWINEINKCTSIEKPDGIESMRTIADTNPKLKEVFNKRLNELKNEK